MYIEQIITPFLSQASYFIESGGEAVVIDPIRDVEVYLQIADKRGVKIKYIFETHFHADFVSGHLDLASKTGVTVVYGPGAIAEYEIYVAADGEEFNLGNIIIKVLHTPGHTAESSCFLLLDENHNPHSVFSGDTLFVGDVGRPDIFTKSGLTKIQSAGLLFDSIETKLKPLPNYVILYPGHGAGSSCGKSIGTETHSTMGIQKQTNYALKTKNKEEFIKQVLDGLPEPPPYFAMDSAINRKGYLSLEKVIEKNYNALSVAAVKSKSLNGAIVIDVRDSTEFEKGFIPGSVSIGLKGTFEFVAGSVIDPESELIIVSKPGNEKQAILRLAQIGYEKVLGFLEGGIDSWVDNNEPMDFIETISAIDFESRFRYNSCTLIDVRNEDEWIPGIVAGSKLITLQNLKKNLNQIDRDKQCFIYCASGYRSIVAASILKRNGFTKVIDISGGMNMLQKTKISIKQLTSSVN